jgi:hypothetical protein
MFEFSLWPELDGKAVLLKYQRRGESIAKAQLFYGSSPVSAQTVGFKVARKRATGDYSARIDALLSDKVRSRKTRSTRHTSKTKREGAGV